MAHRSSIVPAIVFLFSLTAAVNAQDVTIRIATVDNRDMIRMQELSESFTSDNPDITLEWTTLGESILRQNVTTDIATGVGRYDILTIGTYEAPIWAERGWLEPLSSMPDGYDAEDFLPTIRHGLSHDEVLYAAPFYGESSFTMYRTDLFDAAGLEMPEQPDWDFIKSAAAKLTDKNNEIYGICLRGKPGWGENVALITAIANSYGARWFDMDWRPQFDTDAWAKTLNEYVTLLTEHGPPNAADLGYNENLELFKSGKCAMWVDATVAASTLTDPAESTVADSVGFAMAPGTGLDKRSNWLWAWALAISAGSNNIDAAKRFVAWATSPQYAELVAGSDGWANVPPGTRTSLYKNEQYLEAAPFATETLAAIASADPDNPTVEEVPYTGVQYAAIPEFQGIGTAVGNQFAKALAGAIPVEEALGNSQWVTEKVMERAQFLAAD